MPKDFSEILAKLRDEEADEPELIQALLDGLDLEGSDQIKDLSGLQGLLQTLAGKSAKFTDMEAGHTKATQKLSSLEKKLASMGHTDMDAFLQGEPSKKATRRDKLLAMLKKHGMGEHPFWGDLGDMLSEQDEGMDKLGKIAQAAWMFSTMLGQSSWTHQLRTNPKYKGVDEKTMGKLLEKFTADEKGISGFMQDGKNPLEKLYTQLFAEMHPEIVEGKINPASDKTGGGSGFPEVPGMGGAPNKTGKSAGGGRSPGDIAKEIETATGGAVKVPVSGD